MALLGLAAMVGPIKGTQIVGANGFTWPVANGVAGPYEYQVGIWPPRTRSPWSMPRLT